MATDMRRFTISVTSNMDVELNKAKKETYYKNTQNEMIRDLIMRGLQNLEAEKATKKSGCEKASWNAYPSQIKHKQL